jgi:hypothetical protein
LYQLYYDLVWEKGLLATPSRSPKAGGRRGVENLEGFAHKPFSYVKRLNGNDIAKGWHYNVAMAMTLQKDGTTMSLWQ